MEDAELINQILKGNMNAFTYLVNRYQKLVVHITSRLIQRQDELEVVCQDVFLKVYQNLGKYHQFIHQQIELLPVHYRTVLTLYHLDEFSYQEIEQITGMPEGTIKSYLFRAKALLQESLRCIVDESSLKLVKEIKNEK